MERELQKKEYQDLSHCSSPKNGATKIQVILKIFQTTETILNQTLNKQIEAAASSAPTCDRLKNITQPTLVIVGTSDAATPAANSIRMAELIPGSWLVQIKGGGHGLMYQYPEQFSSVVKTFLESTNTQ